MHACASAQLEPGESIKVLNVRFVLSGADVRYVRLVEVILMSTAEARWVATCAICGGDVFQRWLITSTTGEGSLDEQHSGEAECSTNSQHDWRGGSEIPAPV